MSFSAAWLGLREPYDLRARNAAVIDAVVAALAGRPSVTIADLACGTGSTLRALRPRIKARQSWRLADNDLSLLARAPQSSPPDTHVTTMPIDLNHDLEAALDGPVDLVTTSALLDLVSDEWLQRLAVEIAARRLPIYAALSYDGRIDLCFRERRDPGRGKLVRKSHSRDLGCNLYHDGSRSLLRCHPGNRCCPCPNAPIALPARRRGSLRLDLRRTFNRRTTLEHRDLVVAERSSIRVGHVDFFARPTGKR